jgi:cystathionine gamma-synthase
MTAFAPIPLGQRIPSFSLHAVSCSLPTMRAVIGYEEKDPAIIQHLTSGYPRFVVHPLLRQAAAHIAHARRLAGRSLWPVSSFRAAQELVAWLGAPEAAVIEHDGVVCAVLPEQAELMGRAKTFLQHLGAFLSSRAAEDYLVHHGQLAAAQSETLFQGDAAGHLKTVLAREYGHGVAAADIVLGNSGMSAIYTAFQAISELQAARGRTLWVQLGWLYLDTIAILQKFTRTPGDYIFQNDVFDLAALNQLFAEHGDRIAGVITEVPTNPLIQTPDLAALHALTQAHGALLVLDPTLASPLNLDVLPYADVVVNSLTKYAASEGDVVAGAVIVNPHATDAAALRQRVAATIEPAYPRDLARLAAQIGDCGAVIAQINRTTPVVVDYLRSRPEVKSLHWSLHPASRENYLRIARNPNAIGSMVSFAVDLPLERFYDRLPLPKGPSFGMKNTLICPFMYLAHYDLVTSSAGRATLAACGLDPNLLRLSVGCEPAADVIAALAEAFG